MMRLKLRTREERGEVRATWLEDEGGLAIVDENGPPLPLPLRAIEAVFARYGKELAVAIPERTENLALALPTGKAHLRAFRFLGYGDVLPTDYLIFDGEGRPPLVAPAPLVADALTALARAAAGAGS
jgi:hypothetical protein